MLVRGTRIAAVGSWREISRFGGVEVVDLGQSALLPGLINAHCHLDYTGMAGHLPPMDVFTDWLKLITELKSGWSYDDYSESWRQGADMLLRTGCTTVADIEAVPELLPVIWRSTPLRVFSFLEIIGMTPRRSTEIVLAEFNNKLRQLGAKSGTVGISPHAPYSTVPDLLSKSSVLALHKGLRMCIHIAESKLEYDMFMRGRGELYNWMRRSGRDMSDCRGRTPVAYASSCGVLNDRLLAVHVNYLGRGDAAVLGKAGVHVVHCPRSHEYFGHAKFQLKRLRRAGVNVCLGTDSLASVLKARREKVRLSMFDEMRVLLANNRDLSPRLALLMSTMAGAKALGFEGKAGEFAPGAFADLIAVPTPASGDVMEAVVHHQGDVSCAMLKGSWAIPPSKFA